MAVFAPGTGRAEGDEVEVDEPYLKGLWGIRASSPAVTATALLGFLDDLAALYPALSSWALDERTTLPTEPERVAELLAQSRPDEPWQLTATSTADRWRAVSVTVRDGNRSTHPIYLNEVTVEPTPVALDSSVLPRHARALLEHAVRRWRPEVVTLATLRLQRAQTSARRRPPVGGLTWFADTRGAVPPVLPEGARTYRLGAGTAVDLLGEDGSFPTPERVAEVALGLDRLGLREPLPQVQRPAAG